MKTIATMVVTCAPVFRIHICLDQACTFVACSRNRRV